jgi:CheY-like chemotaxis protein
MDKSRFLNLNSRILVVDDNESDRLVIRAMLTKLGFQKPDEAEDGAIAKLKVAGAQSQGQPYDIVFVDWAMPILDGLKLLKLIKMDDSISDPIVIMTTGKSAAADVQEALDAGVSDYIVKPISVDILQSKLVKFVRKR